MHMGIEIAGQENKKRYLYMMCKYVVLGLFLLKCQKYLNHIYDTHIPHEVSRNTISRNAISWLHKDLKIFEVIFRK